MPNYLSTDPFAGSGGGSDEEDFSDVKSGASRTARITLADLQRPKENETEDEWNRRMLREGDAAGAAMATKYAPAALAATALPEFAPQIAAFLNSPAGGAIVGGGSAALKGGDVGDVAKGAAVGAGLGFGGASFAKKLLPFISRIRGAAPIAEAAVPAAATVETAAPAVAEGVKDAAQAAGGLTKDALAKMTPYQLAEHLRFFAKTNQTNLENVKAFLSQMRDSGAVDEARALYKAIFLR